MPACELRRGGDRTSSFARDCEKNEESKLAAGIRCARCQTTANGAISRTRLSRRSVVLPGPRSGPVLLTIPGGPADSDVFAGIAPMLAERYTLVTYDPRGNSRSTLDGTPEAWRAEVHADDANLLLAAVGKEPAYVFGSSSGALVGLALAVRHPDRVHTLVAHEPPVTELLPDRQRHREASQESLRLVQTRWRWAGDDKVSRTSGTQRRSAAARLAKSRNGGHDGAYGKEHRSVPRASLAASRRMDSRYRRPSSGFGSDHCWRRGSGAGTAAEGAGQRRPTAPRRAPPSERRAAADGGRRDAGSLAAEDASPLSPPDRWWR
jgi:pimeloyl-ACP methyl ester carboxylesterase